MRHTTPCLLGATCAVLVAATLLSWPAPEPTITLERVQAPSLALVAHRTPTPAPAPDPTPAPTQAPEPPPTVQPVSYSPGSVKARIAETWPGPNVAKVIRLVGCETGYTYDPMIRNPSGKYLGLFQADADFRATYGWGSASVEDQTMMAWRGYQARGWSPWPECGLL